MLNLNEDLKPISHYIKDRERMLQEMFRCVRGHKLQAILPDALKVTLIIYCYNENNMMNEIISYEFLFSFYFSQQYFLVLFQNHYYKQVRLIIDPCFRLIYIHLSDYSNSIKIIIDESCSFFFRELKYYHPLSFRYN